MSKLANALFTYILLMIETCYYKDEHTQFQVFMYGIHKSMIWLLSDIGNAMRGYSYKNTEGKTYTASLTFEHYDFSVSTESPKAQMIQLAKNLAQSNGSKSKESLSWLYNDTAYLPALPDVSLNHDVAPNVPAIPA